MINLNIKPLSVNEAWQGKRFKTLKYKQYEREMLSILPDLICLLDKNIRIKIEFHFSNFASDLDNPIKPFLDILQKKYNINDKNIIELNIKKVKCSKGFECIRFIFF